MPLAKVVIPRVTQNPDVTRNNQSAEDVIRITSERLVISAPVIFGYQLDAPGSTEWRDALTIGLPTTNSVSTAAVHHT